MKRPPSDDLFHLIRSLTDREKRHFRRMTNQSGTGKGYVQLFNEIDKQNIYDEKAILRRMGEDWYGGQLSVAKNYLYSTILKFLTQQYSGPDAVAGNLRLQVQILKEKDLFDQAAKSLEKCRKECLEKELFHQQLQILQLEMELIMDARDMKQFDEKINANVHMQKLTSEKLVNLQAYRILDCQAHRILLNKRNARRAEELQDFEELMRDPLMAGMEAALSLRARLYFLSIQRKYFAYRGDLTKAMHHCREILRILEDNLFLREEKTSMYIRELGNLCSYQFRSSRYKEAWETVTEMQNLSAGTPKSLKVLTGRYFLFKLGICLEMGKAAEGSELIEEINRTLPGLRSRMKLADQYWLGYMAAYFLFSVERFEEASQWLRDMFDGPKNQIRVDLQCAARLLQLINFYEMGEYDLLATHLKNTARFIYKYERMYKFEKLLLKCLRKLSNAPLGAPELRSYWEKQLRQFRELEKEKFEAIGFYWLDVTSWLESKIQGCSVSRIKMQASLQNHPS